jgi:uncharacterized protein YndB with AHSA1/START domain
MTRVPDVKLVRIVPAPRRAVFEAWLDPALLRRFMCPAEGSSVARATSDPRVGGRFQIVMRIGDDERLHEGQYLEIRRYERLAFTWQSAVAGADSHLTLDFSDADPGQTRLSLEHFGLEGGENIRRHELGWTRILSLLPA